MNPLIAGSASGFGIVQQRPIDTQQYQVVMNPLMRDGSSVVPEVTVLPLNASVSMRLAGQPFGYALQLEASPSNLETFLFYNADGRYGGAFVPEIQMAHARLADSATSAGNLIVWTVPPSGDDCYRLMRGWLSSQSVAYPSEVNPIFCAPQPLEPWWSIDQVASVDGGFAYTEFRAAGGHWQANVVTIQGTSAVSVTLSEFGGSNPQLDQVVIHRLLAADDGYAVLWSYAAHDPYVFDRWTVTDSLTFFYGNGDFRKSILIASPAHPRKYGLAWNGDAFGLAYHDRDSGETKFRRYDRDGQSREEVALTEGDDLRMAASGTTFGIVSTGGGNVNFSAVSCQ